MKIHFNERNGNKSTIDLSQCDESCELHQHFWGKVNQLGVQFFCHEVEGGCQQGSNPDDCVTCSSAASEWDEWNNQQAWTLDPRPSRMMTTNKTTLETKHYSRLSLMLFVRHQLTTSDTSSRCVSCLKQRWANLACGFNSFWLPRGNGVPLTHSSKDLTCRKAFCAKSMRTTGAEFAKLLSATIPSCPNECALKATLATLSHEGHLSYWPTLHPFLILWRR